MNGYLEQAIQHALAAKDWRHAAALMSAASQTAMQHGEIYKIKNWAAALPKP